MGPVNGWEFILLVVIAIVVLGPDKMPEYAAKLARLVVQVRRMANDARGQLREQMGPEFEEVNWQQYDPRQYDPRRIVREALLEPLDDAFTIPKELGTGRTGSSAAPAEDEAWPDDGVRATPFDVEAT